MQQVVRQSSDSMSSAERYTVSYLSTEAGMSDISARNTVYQKIRVTFEDTTLSDSVLVTL